MCDEQEESLVVDIPGGGTDRRGSMSGGNGMVHNMQAGLRWRFRCTEAGTTSALVVVAQDGHVQSRPWQGLPAVKDASSVFLEGWWITGCSVQDIAPAGRSDNDCQFQAQKQVFGPPLEKLGFWMRAWLTTLLQLQDWRGFDSRVTLTCWMP